MLGLEISYLERYLPRESRWTTSRTSQLEDVSNGFRSRIDQLEQSISNERSTAWREIRSGGRQRVFSLIKLVQWNIRLAEGNTNEPASDPTEAIAGTVGLSTLFASKKAQARQS